MPETLIEQPVKIEESLGHADEKSILTVAAFLLTTAIWHIPELNERARPPDEDIVELGFENWKGGGFIDPGTFDIREFKIEAPDASSFEPEGSDYYGHLGELIMRAIVSGDPKHSARAVAFGLSSPDDIVRICALGSAVDLFRIDTLNFWQRVSWYFGKSLQETTYQLLGVILSRVFPVSLAGSPPATGSGVQKTTPPGLMLIHGTVLPTSQSNRPDWSVPGTGLLFKYLQGIRPNIYGQLDYFRWEGGYTDYAREVASQNLSDWLQLRQLNGIDAVAHSHGCNILMASTALKARFGKVVLLSCPVHWHKYSLRPSTYTNVHSVRIRNDLVILADRGGQRFPPNTINETILPVWFLGHSDTTTVPVWQKRNLAQFL